MRSSRIDTGHDRVLPCELVEGIDLHTGEQIFAGDALVPFLTGTTAPMLIRFSTR